MEDSTPSETAATGDSRLVATGFNGHHQIHSRDGNISEFSTILSTSSITDRVLFAGWSSTVIATAEALITLGYQRIEPQVNGGDASAENLRCGFGDHNGMMGCLDDSGRLYLVEPTEGDDESGAQGVFEIRSVAISHRLCCRTVEASPLISHIALAQNGRVSLIFQQAPKGHLCHLVEFSTFDAFQRWFGDPSNENYKVESHHMLPGRPKQLSASTACFILLMESGEVYTWGDGRYESLGRSISGEDAAPADRPGLIDALGGLKIVSISTGGWISAAVSEDGALYVWGALTPGSDGSISCLHGSEGGDVSLVEIYGSASEPIDVAEVAVGDNHIIAIAGEERHIFAVGDNKNGQLGLGVEQDFFPDWQQVPNVRGADSIFCGPKTSYTMVKDWK